MGHRSTQVLSEYSQELLRRYKQKMRENDVVGSGLLLQSLESVQEDPENGVYRVMFDMPDHWRYVEQGRQPGSWPPVEAIRKWIDDKPLFQQVIELPNGTKRLQTKEEMTYLIGRKIFEQGIQPKPMLAEARDELYEEFVGRLRQAIAEDILEELRERFEK